MSFWRNPRRVVLLFLLGALALRSAFVVADYRGLASVMVTDSPRYLSEAERWQRGEPMILCARTPGYPLFLAVAGRLNVPFCLLLQAVLGGLTCAVTYWGARRCFGTSAAAAAALFLAFDMTSILSGNVIAPEALFTPLLTGSLFLLLGPRSVGSVVAAAVLLAGAAYVRPVALPLAVLWPVLLGWFGRRKEAGVLFLVVWALLLPWFFRQQRRCGTFAFTTVQWTHPVFWAADVLADVEGVSDEAIHQRLVETVPPSGYPAASWRILRAHPGTFAKLWLKATTITLVSPAPRALRRMFPGAGSVLYLLGAATACLFWLWLPFTLGAGRDKNGILLLATALYLVAAPGTVFTARYRVPAVPTLAVCGAVGVTRFFRRRSTPDRGVTSGSAPWPPDSPDRDFLRDRVDFQMFPAPDTVSFVVALQPGE